MRVSTVTREITCKVVYYGPGMSGKTTNLKVIHDRAPRQNVGELVTLDTHSERTLHFDLLPVDVGVVGGYNLRFEFFTVPGQSYYAATRRLVLEGADGVVFVADSRREALDENIDSMNDLLDNLRHHKLPDDLPVVIQYNKQDLPTALKPEQLDPLLNIRQWPRFTAVASSGPGVLDTMKAITNLVIAQVRAQGQMRPATGVAADRRASEPTAAPAPQSWLITCYRCLNMLETVGASSGDLFTCGACGTALEIADLEHGLTRAPAPPAAPAPPPVPQPAAMPGRPADDSGGYGMLPMQRESSPALRAPGTGSGGQPRSAEASVPFEIEGFDQVAILDDTVQGRRFRVRERASNTLQRALVLSAALVRQPGYLPQIEPYARLASQVRHPHLLPLSGLRQGRETPVLLSSDPSDHESLAHVLARRRVLAPPHAIGVTRQVALALEEAARHGVVHGWLRPEVVLLSPDGNVMVDEIGVPKSHRYLVRELSGASAATEYYLAPEHLHDDVRSDVRSDMFMLGALLFRMITGEGLITGYTAHEALHRSAANGCRTLRQVLPNISRDLDHFVQQLTAVDRKDRFQSYRELIDSLDRFGGGAKRPTLKLTGQAANAAQTGTRSNRPLVRAGTGQVRRAAAAGAPGSGSGSRADVRQQPADGNSSGAVLAVVLIVLAAGGLAAFIAKPEWFNGQRRATATIPPASGESPGRAVIGGPRGPVTVPDHVVRPPPALTAPTPPAEPPRSGSLTLLNRDPTPPPAVPRPVTPPTATPPAATVPPVATPPVAGPLGLSANRGDLLYEIRQHLTAERYQSALAVCERLSDRDERQARMQDIVLRHANRRLEVTELVRRSATVDAAATLIAAASVWSMPGDPEWAAALTKDAESRLPRTVAVAVTPAPTAGTTAPAIVGAPGAAKVSPAATVSAEMDEHLASSQPVLAEQALATLADAPEATALRRKLAVWSRRAAILDAAIKARAPKLRITHPTDHQLWDVSGGESAGLRVTSVSGSGAVLEWPQIAVRDLARICLESAAAPTASDDDHALAVVMQLIVGETVLARVELMKAQKAGADAALLGDLASLIELRRGFESRDLITRADGAARSGNSRLLAECLEQLRRPDRAQQPGVASELARLEAALRRLGDGKAPAATAVMKDRLTFDVADDLASLQRDGAWTVANGFAVPAGNAALTRRDCANARALSLTFQVRATKGTLVVNFRGIRVFADFTAGQLHVSSREQEIRPKAFVFQPNATNSLFIDLRGGSAVVEINNNAESFTLRPGTPSEQLAITVDGGAVVAVDEIALTREGRAVANPVDTARQDALRRLGLEPLGQAALTVAGAITLPATTPKSGIAIEKRNMITGVSFEARGKGMLRLRLGSLGGLEAGQWFEVPLPTEPATARFTVTWIGNIFLIKEADVVVHSGEIKAGLDPTHFMIIAQQEATILSTPALIRQ